MAGIQHARAQGWAGGLSRQSRKHRPPIHWERSCGEELVARVVGRLVFSSFFRHFWSPWARKIDQNCSKSPNRRKNRKITKKLPKTDQRPFDLGSPNGLEIHQKCRKNGSKKSVNKITLQNTAVLAQGCIFRRKTLRFRGISG